MPLNLPLTAQLAGLIPMMGLIIRYLTNLVRYKIEKTARYNKLAVKFALRGFEVQRGAQLDWGDIHMSKAFLLMIFETAKY
jgi:hypothetical protein